MLFGTCCWRGWGGLGGGRGGGVGVGEVGWGEKRRSVRGGGEARGGEGACFFFFRIIR